VSTRSPKVDLTDAHSIRALQALLAEPRFIELPGTAREAAYAALRQVGDNPVAVGMTLEAAATAAVQRRARG